MCHSAVPSPNRPAQPPDHLTSLLSGWFHVKPTSSSRASDTLPRGTVRRLLHFLAVLHVGRVANRRIVWAVLTQQTSLQSPQRKQGLHSQVHGTVHISSSGPRTSEHWGLFSRLQRQENSFSGSYQLPTGSQQMLASNLPFHVKPDHSIDKE